METLKIVGFFGLYFLPFLVAEVRRKRQAGAIGILNLFLGWTVLGWIGALIWACAEDRRAPTIAAIALASLGTFGAFSARAQQISSKEEKKQTERLRKQQEKEELRRPLMVDVPASIDKVKSLILVKMQTASPPYPLERETQSQLTFRGRLNKSDRFALYWHPGRSADDVGEQYVVRWIRMVFVSSASGTQVYLSQQLTIRGMEYPEDVDQKREIKALLLECKQEASQDGEKDKPKP